MLFRSWRIPIWLKHYREAVGSRSNGLDLLALNKKKGRRRLGFQWAVAHGSDASASRVPANGEELGHQGAHRGVQDDEADSVASGGAPGRAPPPEIARRSWSWRRPKDVADGGVDLRVEKTPRGVKQARALLGI